MWRAAQRPTSVHNPDPGFLFPGAVCITTS